MRKVNRVIEDPAARYGFRWDPSTYEEAEKLTGFRLDRRANYLIMRDGQVEQIQTCTVDCSGCSCDCGDGYGCSHEASGCSECGHTGKRRMTFGFPASPPEQRKSDLRLNYL